MQLLNRIHSQRNNLRRRVYLQLLRNSV